jgi:hypothetical protein
LLAAWTRRAGDFLGHSGVVMRILGEDGGAAERRLAGALPLGGGLGLDLSDPLSDVVAGEAG